MATPPPGAFLIVDSTPPNVTVIGRPRLAHSESQRVWTVLERLVDELRLLSLLSSFTKQQDTSVPQPGTTSSLPTQPTSVAASGFVSSSTLPEGDPLALLISTSSLHQQTVAAPTSPTLKPSNSQGHLVPSNSWNDDDVKLRQLTLMEHKEHERKLLVNIGSVSIASMKSKVCNDGN